MRGALLAVLTADTRRLVRDPLALVVLLLLPLAAPPLGAILLARLAGEGPPSAAAPLVVQAPPELGGWLERDDALRLGDGSLPEGEVDAVVEHTGEGWRIRYDGTSEASRAARDRLRDLLGRVRARERARAFREHGIPIDPAELVRVEWVDVAPAAEREGRPLGRILPLALVLLVASGSLYTALDVLTGERERGTAETLFTTRADRRALLGAKALLVIATALAGGWLGLAGTAIAVAANPALGSLAPGAILPLALLVVALALELGGILVLAAVWAPSFRTGEAMAVPLVLVLLALAAVALLPGLQPGPVALLLPVGNLALLVREVAATDATAGATAWTLGGTALHLALIWRWALRLVGREETLLGGSAGRRRATGRHGPEVAGLLALVAALTWFPGQLASARNPIGGHVLGQLVFLLLPALLAPAWIGRPVAATLRLRRPALPDLLLAAVLGLAATGLTQGIAVLQSRWLPAPTALVEGMDTLLGEGGRSLATALLLWAILPAACEETLFRGAVLGLLASGHRCRSAVLVSGLAFGAMHLSIFRFAPTTALGVLLAVAALRSRSLAIPVVAHAFHNGVLLVLAAAGPETLAPPGGLLALGALAAAAAVLGMGRPRRPRAAPPPAS